MNTLDNNKIIAEFLGLKTIAEKDFLDYNYDTKDLEILYVLESLKYDLDWNKLMEVVEKCFSIEHNYHYHKNIEDALIYNSKNRIEAVYLACIEFIEVYNESLKQESCTSIRDFNFSQNK